ncbi:MAG: MATE family efflux transporter [Paludibacteraceae bacterium]|nr:MATE family efflux transporter [Paludibacteraceae bacterium]
MSNHPDISFPRLREYLPYYRRNLAVAFPVMLTQLGAAIVGLADCIMVGHYSTTDLAAVSFANGIFFTFMVFAMGAVMGVTPLVGHAFVQHDDSRVSSLLQNGLWFTVLLGGVTTLVLAACVPLMPLMGQDPAVVTAARPYLVMRILSLLPFLLFCLQKQFLEGLGNTMVAMLICLGLNLLNILLNWVFIFGHWGAEPMGAYGAGLASLIATALMPVAFVIAIAAKPDWRRYLRLFSRTQRSRSLLRELADVGFPIGLQTTMETVLFTISFIMVGWISKEALAAHQVTNQVADFAFMLSLGVGSATTIRVSHQYGLGDLRAMRMAANASIHLVLLMNTLGAALMIGLRHYIPYLFTSDGQVVELASQLLIFAGLFQYADGLQCVGAGMLRGVTDVKAPMWITVVTYVFIALPLGYVLMFPAGLGAVGMWISFLVALILAAVAFHLRFRWLFKGK